MESNLQEIHTAPTCTMANPMELALSRGHSRDNELFYDRFRFAEYLTGDKEASKPPYLRIEGDEKAAELLIKHLQNGSTFLLHTDVDLDGIGSCKILTEYLRQRFHCFNTEFFINKERVHGINEQYVKYWNSTAVNNDKQLVVILDSSCNEAELLKQMECDVIVIDHHQMDGKELYGKTRGGEFIILNYSAQPELADSESLSAGMETFEFLRWFDETFVTPGQETILVDNRMYQWAVSTLFSDVMNNDNLRNIYWITQAQQAVVKEPSLNLILNKLGRTDVHFSKSNVLYSLAPAFNRAIRGGASGEALDYALNNPDKIDNLLRFRTIQDVITANPEDGAYEFDNYIIKDITNSTINGNYAGLIASKLLDKYNKTTIVYRNINGVLVGSMRGKSDNVDYCKVLRQAGFYAQGHATAFGFRIPIEYIQSVMEHLVSLETVGTVPYLVYGMDERFQASHRIESLEAFRDSMMMWRLGILNSYLSTDVEIMAPSHVARYISGNAQRTYFQYEVDNLTFSAFQEIISGNCILYAENQDYLRLYIKNKWR